MTKHTNPTDSPLSAIEEAEIAASNADRDITRIYGETQTHRTAEAFAEATGLSIEMIRAHKITSYNSATGVPLHVLQEEATLRNIIDRLHPEGA